MGACLKMYSPPPPSLSNVCVLFCRHMSWPGVQSLCSPHYRVICGCAFPATHDGPHRVHVPCVVSQSSETRNQHSPAPGIPNTPWPEFCPFQTGTQIFGGTGDTVLYPEFSFSGSIPGSSSFGMVWVGKEAQCFPTTLEGIWLVSLYL